MVKKNKIDLRDIFMGLQSQMLAKLTFNRKTILHPGTKGDACELEWIDMLTAYLPSRYCADKAFIIDCNGNLSQQIDVVVFDRHYSPFILRQNGASYIPAESVYAVFEVKQELSSRNIEYAAVKAESVRRLHRTSAHIVEASGKEYSPKVPFTILAGILTVEGVLTKAHAATLCRFPKEKSLQVGCSLGDSSFCLRNEAKKVIFEQSKKNDGLIFFFLNLLSQLQQLGTVPAIDLACYIKPLHLGK